MNFFSIVIKNILAIIVGFLGGSLINICLIQLGNNLIPIQGIDPNDMDAFAAIMPDLSLKYFIFPFLAHAIGTLSGAIIAGLIAASHKMKFSLSIGVLFLLGGAYMFTIISAPLWFTLTDLLIAYLPMAWLGGKISLKMINNR